MMSKHKVSPFDSLGNHSKSEKVRRKIQEIIDGKVVAVIMGIVTLWVLFGDDLRLLLTSKSADTAFFATFFICLILFIIEIVGNSIFLQDYKFTFFFWLDVVATISLIPDIPIIFEPFLLLFGVELYKVSVDYSTSSERNTLSESYVTRGIQTIRYIRLVRIVKLYKYFTKKKAEDPNTQSVSSSMDAEVLGKKLSDITTRRVIIGVLALLLLLPLLQVKTVDNAKYYGLQQIYWIGTPEIDESLADPYVFSMTEAGWNYTIVRYSKNSETSEGSGVKYPLLWLHVPSRTRQGELHDVEEATDPITGKVWKQDDKCTGKSVPSDCDLRDEEMRIITYGPNNCEPTGCKKVKAFARFNMQKFTREQAVMSIAITCFVGFILAVASFTFARDTQVIVIRPVNKMVAIIRGLAKEPLKSEEVTPKKSHEKGSILEETIDKIGILLKINFGTRGSSIMSELLANDMPFKSDKIKGNKHYCIISIVKIQDSAQIIECLAEEVLVFINKIAKIVHCCANRWEGHICRNDMSGFLMLWDENKTCEALVALIKTYAELHRANDIMAYKSNPKISGKFQSNNYMVDLQMSAHVGEIIEGPIGSNIKIMPDYIGPSISLAKKVQSLNSFYETNLLMTDSFYSSLPPHGQKGCRKIDNVQIAGHFDPIELYTFDLSEVNLPDVKRLNMNDEEYKIDNRKPGDPVYDGGYEFKDYEAQDLFGTDNDIVTMTKTASVIDAKFSQGLELYLNGSWVEAYKVLDLTLEDRPAYGPIKAIKKFIESYNQKAPEDWQGIRIIN
jgi:hypothetical protein